MSWIKEDFDSGERLQGWMTQRQHQACTVVFQLIAPLLLGFEIKGVLHLSRELLPVRREIMGHHQANYIGLSGGVVEGEGERAIPAAHSQAQGLVMEIRLLSCLEPDGRGYWMIAVALHLQDARF